MTDASDDSEPMHHSQQFAFSLNPNFSVVVTEAGVHSIYNVTGEKISSWIHPMEKMSCDTQS